MLPSSVEAAHAELAAAQAARTKAERVLKDAKARETAAKDALKAAKAAQSTTTQPINEDVAPELEGERKRKGSNSKAVEEVAAEKPRKLLRGRGDDGFMELPDTNKNSLEALRFARKAKQFFMVDERVEAKFEASSRGGQSAGWFKGKVAARHDRGETYVYDIKFDDGDKEENVLPQYVRSLQPPSTTAARAPAAAARAPAAAPVQVAAAALPAAAAASLAPPLAPVTRAPPPPPPPAAAPARTPPPTPARTPPPTPARATAPPTSSPAQKAVSPKGAQRAASAPAPPPQPRASADVGECLFTYSEPWHASADQCQQHGCRLQHVKLQDFLPNAQSGDRNKLRNAVRSGKMIGTASVPKPGEAGTGSMRDKWWWHAGDPALGLARQMLRK